MVDKQLSWLITQPNEATPSLVTAVLEQRGILQNGRIASIQITHTDRDNFANEHILALTYDGIVKPAVPEKLLLRISFPGKGWPNEPRFINDIVPVMSARWPSRPLPLVTAYEAVYDPVSKSSYLLREDISQTHFKAQGNADYYTRCCEQVMAGWALVHATFWEHPQLTSLVGPLMTDALMDGFLQDGQQNLPRLLHTMDAHLSSRQKEILKLVPSKWPERRRQRNIAGQGATLGHHTASPEVILFPHDPETHDIKITTWEPWRVDNGTIDPAYYMGFWWSKAERVALERPMLAHYHQQLVANRVDNYSWDDCRYDYRASIIRLLLQLVQSWKPVHQHNWFWAALLRGLVTFDDWDCEELLR